MNYAMAIFLGADIYKVLVLACLLAFLAFAGFAFSRAFSPSASHSELLWQERLDAANLLSGTYEKETRALRRTLRAEIAYAASLEDYLLELATPCGQESLDGGAFGSFTSLIRPQIDGLRVVALVDAKPPAGHILALIADGDWHEIDQLLQGTKPHVREG